MTDLEQQLHAAGRVLADLDAIDDPATAMAVVDRLEAVAARLALFRLWLDRHPQQAAAAGWAPEIMDAAA